MSITKGSEWLGNRDTRWKAWMKLIRSQQDIDLSRENGYSITANFIPYSDSVVVKPGDHLVIANDTGSVKNHSYNYAFVVVGEDGELEDIDVERARKNALDAALAAGVVTEEQRAKAKNSALYGYALWAWARYQTGAASSPVTPAATVDPLAASIEAGIARINNEGAVTIDPRAAALAQIRALMAEHNITAAELR